MLNSDNNFTPAELVCISCSTAIFIFLIAVFLMYMLRWKHNSMQIMQVLGILIANEICEVAFETLGYLGERINQLCSLSLIGRLAFTVAANFWIIFITRLIYIETLAPGKYYNLVNFVFRNILITYVPLLILSIFLLIMILVKKTNENKCWSII